MLRAVNSLSQYRLGRYDSVTAMSTMIREMASLSSWFTSICGVDGDNDDDDDDDDDAAAAGTVDGGAALALVFVFSSSTSSLVSDGGVLPIAASEGGRSSTS